MNSIPQVQQDLLGRMDRIRQAAEGPGIASANPLENKAETAGFGTAFGDIFQSVDAQQHKASEMAAAVESGASDDLVGAILESQKASVSFTALLQVRNKVASAFEEVMRMPI
ncbi:MAG TPA: flagellar hook-basal body complex protein FliE [Dongiaceae bacterium]|nr:flagellar hook-basal body complex protein FliE [Dongiaceae bacterium]